MSSLWDDTLSIYNYYFPPTTSSSSSSSSVGISDFVDVSPIAEGFQSVISTMGNFISSFFLWLFEMSIWATLELYYLSVIASLKVVFEILETFGIFDVLANALNSLDSETISVLHYVGIDKLALYCLSAMLARFILRVYWR